MKITFLDTGSIIPSPEKSGRPTRSYSAILVEVPDETLLLDIGPGTCHKMVKSGMDILQKPDRLFMTHYHTDHCLDFLSLVKARCFDPVTGGVAPGKVLPVYGPSRLLELSRDVFEKTERWKYHSEQLHYQDVVRMKETDNGLVEETKGWKVTCMPVKHYDGVAYRIESGGKSFVYSGDMVYDENISDLGKDADLVALECSFPSRKTLKGMHLCPEDIAELARLGGFKKVVLTHMYPQCYGRESEMTGHIEKVVGCKAVAAYDGMTLEV